MNVEALFKAKLDRRRFLGQIGVMGAGTALAMVPAFAQAKSSKTAPNVDAGILTFALNLEYLEAAFYLAAVGRLDELPGDTSKVILPAGFSPTTFTNDFVAQYAEEIAEDELAHVRFLRSALSAAGAPVAELPVIDLDRSFKAAAAAAGLPFASEFDPFANEPFFLFGAYIFEDVGVTAYNGAAPFVTDPDILEAAAGLLAVEGYHASEVRTVLFAADVRRRDLYGGLDTWTIARAISDARDSLDGNSDLDQGIVGNTSFGDVSTLAHGGANIVPTDANGITYARTPRQVANIVYLSPNTVPGGFFPEGITVPAGLEDQFAILLSL